MFERSKCALGAFLYGFILRRKCHIVIFLTFYLYWLNLNRDVHIGLIGFGEHMKWPQHYTSNGNTNIEGEVKNMKFEKSEPIITFEVIYNFTELHQIIYNLKRETRNFWSCRLFWYIISSMFIGSQKGWLWEAGEILRAKSKLGVRHIKVDWCLRGSY